MPASLRDIAREAGVSTAAVSQALRGVGRLSTATRERIRASAAALGYSPDPLLSKVFSKVRTPGRDRYRETFALILEWKTETSGQYQKDICNGATERAASAGYALESFIVSGAPSQHRRLSGIFRARGIRGMIIVPRLGLTQPRLHFQWQHFAAVEIGRTLWQPRRLHHVATEGYQNTCEALHLLKKVGYKRIGMAVEPTQNRHQNGVFYAAFLLWQLRQPMENRIPIFCPTGAWTEKNFKRWLDQHRPDVLVMHRYKLLSEWLRNLKLRVPQDISLFCINAQNEVVSGLRRDYRELGHSAVEMLSLLLSNHELGLPLHPRTLSVDEFWQPGSTLSRPIGDYISKDGALISQAAPSGGGRRRSYLDLDESMNPAGV